jgi:uncharacterized protein
VKLIVPEPGTSEVAAVWSRADRLVSSQLLYPEARAAVARALTIGRLGRRRLPAVRRMLEELWARLDRVVVTEKLVRQAGDLAEEHGLRAYDAVHVASLQTVADPDVVLVASDGNLIAAAQSGGISATILPCG